MLLSPVAEHPTPESLKRLEHECSLREALDPAWAARPIGIARHSDRTVLVLEDPGGAPLDQLLGHPLDLALSLRLAIGLSSAINRLHQRGIIHKLPRNATRQRPALRVIFGAALLNGKLSAVLTNSRWANSTPQTGY